MTRSDGCGAYAEVGADCLYAPRIDTVEQVEAIVAAVSPTPVNLLINFPLPREGCTPYRARRLEEVRGSLVIALDVAMCSALTTHGAPSTAR